MTHSVTVRQTGPFATVQDLGRPGYEHFGVSRSGAADPAALALANRLVGNPPGAAGIEITLGGFSVGFEHATTMALTGAECDGADHFTAFTLPAGSVLTLQPPSVGLRTYLAIRGGCDVTPVLGSRSCDTLSGLGPAPLNVGDRIPIGPTPPGPVDGAIAVPLPRPERLRIQPGPRDDWFTPDAMALLLESAWTVRGDSDRVGVRLDGPELPRQITHELPSEPTVPGALQVPTAGRPILLGPDAPVTGGYPVIAVLRSESVTHFGQLRAGDTVRFRL